MISNYLLISTAKFPKTNWQWYCSNSHTIAGSHLYVLIKQSPSAAPPSISKTFLQNWKINSERQWKLIITYSLPLLTIKNFPGLRAFSIAESWKNQTEFLISNDSVSVGHVRWETIHNSTTKKRQLLGCCRQNCCSKSAKLT